MRIIISAAFTVFALCPLWVVGQVDTVPKDAEYKSAKGVWVIGLGINAVDDSGNGAVDLFDVEGAWNIVPYPSRLNIGRLWNNGIGAELIGTYNKYDEGKDVDNVIIEDATPYYAIDARLSYDLSLIFGDKGWFDPYVGAGFGYAKANEVGRFTANAVVGFRTWLSPQWALDFNSSGKWALSDAGTNHLQHAVGIMYKFKEKVVNRTPTGRVDNSGTVN